MSVYRRSVNNCVSFPWVVYFCLFSPLKDRYAFSICLHCSFWGLRPQTPNGALPLNPAGDLPSPDPFCPPLANFWLRPCAALFKSTMPTCSRSSVNWLSMSLSRHTCQIYLASGYFPASSSLISWVEKCHDRLPTVKKRLMSRLLIWFAYFFVIFYHFKLIYNGFFVWLCLSCV